jgi:opacity protein-like surface antigen
MKKLSKSIVIGLAVSCSFIYLAPFQSQAGETDNYFALRGGFAVPQDMDISVSGGGSVSTVSFENGYTVSIAYGRRLVPWLRGEIEVGWTEIDADKLSLKKRGVDIDDEGKDEHFYGMLNALADWQNDSAFTPYIGIGIGATKATLDNTYVWPGSGKQITRDSSDTAFAYQFMFGALWDINTNWGLELRGRYFSSQDRTHDNHAAGIVADLEVDGSQVWTFDMGVSYKF